MNLKPYQFQREQMERIKLTPGGKIVICSTPNDSNWFYKAYQRMKKENEAIILGSNGVEKFNLLFGKYLEKGKEDGKSA